MVEARSCGKFYYTFIIVFWCYYTVWMLITPIIDADHPIQSYFFSRENGLLVTTAGAYYMLAFLFTMVGVILIKDKY
jgi:dolichyl-phosphate mannosyltransferase polypeptide 2 regulatory subunit